MGLSSEGSTTGSEFMPAARAPADSSERWCQFILFAEVSKLLYDRDPNQFCIFVRFGI